MEQPWPRGLVSERSLAFSARGPEAWVGPVQLADRGHLNPCPAPPSTRERCEVLAAGKASRWEGPMGNGRQDWATCPRLSAGVLPRVPRVWDICRVRACWHPQTRLPLQVHPRGPLLLHGI